MALRLDGLRFTNDSEVVLEFKETDSGDVVGYTFDIAHEPVRSMNSRAFASQYRQVPGPVVGEWVEPLIGAAIHARENPLPSGAAMEELIAETRAEVGRLWRASREADPPTDVGVDP